MTTNVILVRHAVHDLVDRVLVGRMPDVGLSPRGVAQAERLARHLATCGVVDALQSSLQLRARQTARPIALALGLDVEIAAGFEELDMGEWTGRSFAELESDPHWQRWNSERSNTRPPGGESMWELQERVMDHLAQIPSRFSGGRVVIVSHAEPIRAVLLQLRCMPLDGFATVQVDPASLTTVRHAGDGWRIVSENLTLDSMAAA
ncbi:histidine phosphatase family protein [Xanthobacteraceae bacterium Astr-EGSB]|uniref:histidine phosphatase family protein n=1 Tax=Astrobacterium formosum TaxID=3069710 RepID=UPI0027B2C1F9|nr:histidine phosphatase family protein [Xanthobacteraceae bacterium Astr-EGSB]